MPTEEDWHSHNRIGTITYQLQTSMQQLHSQLVSIDLTSQEGTSQVTGDMHATGDNKALALTLEGYCTQDAEYIKIYLATRDTATQKLTHMFVMNQVGSKSASMAGLYSGKMYTLPENLDAVTYLTLSDLTKLERLAIEKVTRGEKVPRLAQACKDIRSRK